MVTPHPAAADRMRRPRLGFLGVGWIGHHRMASLQACGLVDIAAVADAAAENRRKAAILAPRAAQATDLEGLLDLGLDGLVIATPSGQHAGQARQALAAGLPVFCQKPLALNGRETREVLAAARDADRLLGVDLSYRCVEGLERMRRMVREGAIGRVFAVDLVFHNAYGPDKPWYYDKNLAGGGCLMDLGTHLVDLMRQVLPETPVREIRSRLYAGGRLLGGAAGQIEDYADVQMTLAEGVGVRLACSWRLQAGREALIRAAFYGTGGGVCLRNVNGSFYRFQVEHYEGTATRILAPASDSWWGQAAVRWARALTADAHFDPTADDLAAVADILDGIYAAA